MVLGVLTSVADPTSVGDSDCTTDFLIVSVKMSKHTYFKIQVWQFYVGQFELTHSLGFSFQIAGGGTEAQAMMLTPPRLVGQTRYCGRRFNIAGAMVDARVCCKYI